MDDRTGTTIGPEPGPEHGPVSVPAAAQALGISERAVRKRIHAGTLRAAPFGRSFMVWLPEDAPPAGPEPGPALGPEHGPEPGPEPIEARFTSATPAEVERAIERTAGRYVADFAALYDRIAAEVGQLYEAQLVAKDETIATQRELVAHQAEILAEARDRLDDLRRRAEAAEAELSAIRLAHERERDELRAQASPAPPSEAPTILVMAEASTSDKPVQSLWQRLRRALGGE